MASYHFAVQIIARSKGGNTLKAAAYRAAAKLRDAAGAVHDFSRRRGVVHTEILAPEGSAAFLRDRQQLWSHVEQLEKRRDAQLAREINLALPAELTDAQRLALVRGFIQEQFVARGMVADFAIHAPVAEKGDDSRNHHAHVMVTLRQATPEGLRKTKTREWNSDELLKAWREAWAKAQNRALERAGQRDRVDHRTLAAQRQDARARGDRPRAAMLDRQPEIHVGPKARAMSGRGVMPARKARTVATSRPQGGVWYSSPDRDKRRREVDYGRFDQMTRYAWNLGRIDANRERFARRRDRHELYAARVRNLVLRAQRTGAGPKRRPRRPGHGDWLLMTLEAIIGALLGIERRHVDRRRGLVRYLDHRRSRSGGRTRTRF